MAFSIPLPRRGLRSLVVLVLLLLGPYLLIRHISTLTTDTRDSPNLPTLRKKGGIDVYGQGKERVVPKSQNDEPVLLQEENMADPLDPLRKKNKPKAQAKQVTTAIGVEHEYRRNGLLLVNPDGQHPIYDLVGRAKTSWAEKLGKASQSLPEAVDEYRRRYHRAPPKGFERW
jgi:hypothetical protein